MVKLSKLKEEFRKEVQSKKSSQQLNRYTEEIEKLVIDLGYTTGGLAILYSLDDGYISPITPEIKEVEKHIRDGKTVKIKGLRVVGTKRITQITGVKVEDDPDIPEKRIMKGELEWIPPRMRFVSEDGEIYYVDMGSINYEKLSSLPGGTYPVIIIPSILYTRKSRDGQREFKRIRGFTYILIEEEEEEILQDENAEENGEDEKVYDDRDILM